MDPWEILEYLGESLVFIGVVGEVYAEWSEPHKVKLGKACSILLIIGLALSLAALIATNESFNTTIASLNLQASQAVERAANADLKRSELENRVADIFGPRVLTPEQSARIAGRLRGLTGTKVDVYVYAVDNPYTPADFEDSKRLAIAVAKIFRSSNLDVGGWILDNCQGASASNVVVGTTTDKEGDSKVALQLIKALQQEIGTDPKVEKNFTPNTWCETSSPLDKSVPNTRPHGAPTSIIIGRKINPPLTREMLEPPEKKPQP